MNLARVAQSNVQCDSLSLDKFRARDYGGAAPRQPEAKTVGGLGYPCVGHLPDKESLEAGTIPTLEQASRLALQ